MEELGLQVATITFVDPDKKTVSAQSRLDGAIIPNIPLDCPLHRQYMPMVGQMVLLLRLADRYTRILAEFGERQFDAPIQPGEILIEGSGGGSSYFNQEGDVYLSDATMSNVIKILSGVGFNITGDAISITIKGIGQINIIDDKIEVIKTTASGTGTSTTPVAKVSITNDKIDIDHVSVNIGRGIMGSSVTTLSGVPGDHSIDFMTGLPIPGSSSVKNAL